MKSICIFFPLLYLACGQSVTSCGGSTDHLKGVKITINPDPIAKGSPFSFSLTGDLDKTITAGNADVDLSVKALGIINKPVKVVSPFTFSPGFVAGPQTLTVGPVSLPSLPGDLGIAGTVKITDDKSEAVACLKFDLDVPAMKDEVKPDESHDVTARGATVCNQPSDHLKDLVTSSSRGVSTAIGTMDEAVQKVTINTDLTLKIGFLSHKIDMAVPITYTPGMTKGDFKFTAGPKQAELLRWPHPDVTVSGTVKAVDGNSEEILCLAVESVAALPDKSVQAASSIVV
jgi:hypothetical protein